MPSPFVHLHVHSHYSLLEALPKSSDEELQEMMEELEQMQLGLENLQP